MRMIVAFQKTEQVRHLGHLDLLRAMQRALRRSGLSVRYSQGFNPHMIMSFAAPLSVGASGLEELFDVALEAPMAPLDFAKALTPSLPLSLPLVATRAIEDKHPALMASLRTAEYRARLPEGEAARAMLAAVPDMLAREEIIALRRTKKGEKPCDIRPMIHLLTAEDGEAPGLHFRTSLTEQASLRPDLLLRTLADIAGVQVPEGVHLCRLRLYGGTFDAPVPLMES